MDEIKVVASLRPQPTGPSPTAVATARARLDHEIRLGDGAPRQNRLGGADRPRFAWRRLTWAAAMSLVAVAGLTAVAVREEPPAGPVAVTGLLDAAAKGAAARPFTAPRADQYAYRDQIVIDTDASGDHREQHRSWQSVGNPATDVVTCSRKVTEPLAEFDCDQPAHASAPPTAVGGADIDSYHYLMSLSRDPDKLLATLRGTIPAGSPDAVPVTLAGMLTDVLASPLAPPDLRAATVRAVARLPGVQTEQSVADAAGRIGTAVSWTNDGMRYELVFKADGSEYLGYRMVLIQAGRYLDLAGVAAGTVVHSRALLGSGIVDRARQLP
ncbi:CU044_5270 family protein [Phytohabitans sp. LJ34]|uniref:CU044_5270 family protein n=1 Tax=Phytohabitans sp. LJ34 TaxID=3452217 RepID=UPI003F8AF5B4